MLQISFLSKKKHKSQKGPKSLFQPKDKGKSGRQSEPVDLPSKFLLHMRERLGEEFGTFLEAMEQKPPTFIRANPAKKPDLFKNEQIIPWCETGRYLKERPAFVWDPLYHAGAYYAQEASSMFFANAIDFSKPLKVLDLCAAPGGKSSLILANLHKDSLLVSNELVGKRAAILNENLVKWGAANCVITSSRASEFQAFEGFFDVVLIDAPCSGEGMFRKDKGAIEQWSDALVMQCSAIQKEILDYAVQLIAPGGMLVYSTCTFEPRENEQNIQYLYEKNPGVLEPADWKPDAAWSLTPAEIKTRAGIQYGYYSYPHKVKGEGLFLSAMRIKNQQQPRIVKGNKNILRRLTQNEENILAGYAEIDKSLQAVAYKDDVWLIPSAYVNEIAFMAEKLNLRKPGIKAGTLIRDQFIPDHALAMSGKASKQIPRVALDKTAALDYMQRKNVKAPDGTPNGWILFTYDGIDIGWAKNLGNRVNNHYPAEWRIRKEPRLNEVFIPEEDEVAEW